MGGQQSVSHFFSSQSHHVVMVGLDGAGKTTVLYRIKTDQHLNTVPTVGFNCEKVKGQIGKSKGVSFTVWDIGGQDKLRPLWSTYMHHTEGIIYVVDSSDYERFEEARIEITKISKNNECIGVPIVIIANKQDIPCARCCADLERSLALHDLTATHPWSILPATAITGDGLLECIDTLHNLMIRHKKTKSKAKKK